MKSQVSDCGRLGEQSGETSLTHWIRSSVTTEGVLEPHDSTHCIFLPTGQGRRQRSNHWSRNKRHFFIAGCRRQRYTFSIDSLAQRAFLATECHTVSAENKFLLQIHFQEGDKSLSKDMVTISSHSNQVDWKPGFPQQVVQNPLWQSEEPTTATSAIGLSAWRRGVGKKEGTEHQAVL